MPTPPRPSSPPSPPSAHLRALVTWIAVYPTITIALALLGPAIADLPLPVQTLILTVVVVPPVSYLLMPRLLAAAAATRARMSGQTESE